MPDTPPAGMPSKRSFPSSPRALAHAVALVSSGILAVFAVLALFASPAADDYCYAVKMRDLGFLAAQREWYADWSGRYTANALVSSLTLGQWIERDYGLTAVGVIALTTAAFFAFVCAVLGRSQPWSIRIAAALATAVLFLEGLPDIAQTIYWATGSLTYASGNIALLFLLALLVYMERRGGLGPAKALILLAVAAPLTIFAMGTNEATLVCTLVLLAGAMAVAWRRRHRSRLMLSVLLGIALPAAVLSLAAPGNQARAASLAGDTMLRPSGYVAAVLYLPWVVLRLGYWLANVGVWASAVLVIAATWAKAQARLRPQGAFDRRWFIVPAGWLALLFLVNGLGFAVNHYPLPERAESVTYLVFLLGWYPSSVILYHALSRPPESQPSPRVVSVATALLIVGLAGAPTVFEAFKDSYRGYRYWREMAARVDLIRRAKDEGRLVVEVPSISRPPRTLFATELTTDSSNFRNSCAAAWYGVSSLRLGSGP
jgi:hypothetical protein